MKWTGLWLLLPICAPFTGVAGTVSAAASHLYEPAPFSQYQPILDRMPFGALPSTFNPNAAVDLEQQQTEEQLQAQQQQIAKQITFSAINVTPKGTTAVGFTDRSVNPPENYYLEVGAMAGGWTVLDADYDEEWAQFEKDDIIITMSLGKGLIDDPPASSPAVPIEAPAPLPASDTVAIKPANVPPAAIPGLVRLPAAARITPPTPTAEPPPASDHTVAKSFLERLRERKAQEKAEKKATERAAHESLQDLARKIAQDELAKREQETAATLEQLRLAQELFEAQEALAQQAEHAQQQAMPEADAQPEPEPEAAPEAE